MFGFDQTLTPLGEDERTRALSTISQAASEGLSLEQGAALAGVPYLRLAAWIELADGGTEPWASWLVGIARAQVERRQRLLADLKQLGDVDPRARRDYLREAGRQSVLERELAVLRRVKGASACADAERDAAERGVERAHRSSAMRRLVEQQATDLNTRRVDIRRV